MTFEWVLVLVVFAACAETIASYSGRYTADLEQKQALLESIREDDVISENAIKASNDEADVVNRDKASYSRLERIDLARIMPPTEKMKVALISMNGTLSPSTREERVFKKKNDR
jgi:hypothetical protein